MSHCKTAKILYALVPLKSWRGFLIRSHIEKCPRCQAGLASREAVGSLLVQEREAIVDRSLWIGVESALRENSGRESMRGRADQPAIMRRWGWAAAASFLLVLIAGFLLINDFRPEGEPSAAIVPARFELEYVRVGGLPANTVIYQPQGSDMIIVWAGKSP